MVSGLWSLVSGFAIAAVSASTAAPAPETRPLPPVLVEIDRTIRSRFFDPKLKGVDWDGAIAKAAEELSGTPPPSPGQRDAIYDRLLASLNDSHTFRMPAGELSEGTWGSAGLRIGRDGEGYAVKGVVPGGPAFDTLPCVVRERTVARIQFLERRASRRDRARNRLRDASQEATRARTSKSRGGRRPDR